MEMSQETQLLHNFERDSKWFHEHVDELRKRGFTAKFVAIKNREVLSANRDVDLLVESLEKKNVNPSYLFIEFVYPEGFTLIL